jgi:hypothetical protein
MDANTRTARGFSHANQSLSHSARSFATVRVTDRRVVASSLDAPFARVIVLRAVPRRPSRAAVARAAVARVMV